MRGIQIEPELQLQSVCGCLLPNICVCVNVIASVF